MMIFNVKFTPVSRLCSMSDLGLRVDQEYGAAAAI